MTWYLQQQNHDMMFTTAKSWHDIYNSQPWSHNAKFLIQLWNYDDYDDHDDIPGQSSKCLPRLAITKNSNRVHNHHHQSTLSVITVVMMITLSVVIMMICGGQRWSPYQWGAFWSRWEGWWSHIERLLRQLRQRGPGTWETSWRKSILCILTCRVRLRACHGSWALWQKDPRRSPPQVFPEESLLLTIVMVCVKVMMAIKMF